MNWGWYDKVQKVIKEQADFARKQEEERQQRQEENWQAIVKYFSGIRTYQYLTEKIKSGEWIDWLRHHQTALSVLITIGGAALLFILPMIGSTTWIPGGTPIWLRLLKLVAFAGVILIPFVAGKRKLLQGNISAMRLVRMDRNGHPVGRETAMTRQDIEQVRSYFHGTAKLFYLGGFEPGTYGIFVDKDYKRKFTLYFNAGDKSVFRASRHLWTWRLTENETKRFYEFLQKYVDRLGESEELNDLSITEKQDTLSI